MNENRDTALSDITAHLPEGADLAERRAWFAYEAARLENAAMGRPINPEPWEERADDFRENMIRSVDRQCGPGALSSPEALHNAWWDAYLRLGWRYGPVRDPVAKTHPDMVPFEELPRGEREKDRVFYLLCLIAADMHGARE